jgi:signal transduction histidine kinase
VVEIVLFATHPATALLLTEYRKPSLLRTLRRRYMQDSAAEERFRLLGDLSIELATSLNFEQTLETVERLLVPRFADWCILHISDGQDVTGQSLFLVRTKAANPDQENLLSDLAASLGSSPRSAHPAAAAMRRGETYFAPRIDESSGSVVVDPGEQHRLIRALDGKSLIVVPLRGKEDIVGFLSLARSESICAFVAQDVALSEEIARRVAIAVGNARLYEEARHAVRGRDEILAAVSHDLKNPLAAIKGQAQLLLRQLNRSQPEIGKLTSRATSIIATTVTMTKMIDELVDTARLQIGQQLELDLSQVDLSTIARAAVEEIQQTTHEHQIRLHVDGADGNEALIGTWDAARLERVMGNLLGNAVKYSPAGGDIKVTLRRARKERLSWAIVEVRDYGLGIPSKDLPFIFDQFRRGRQPHRHHIPGSGIGLSTARQIVIQHGGRIEVESKPGQGSLFTVWLPFRLPKRRRKP